VTSGRAGVVDVAYLLELLGEASLERGRHVYSELTATS
jgi:hypothetical protein